MNDSVLLIFKETTSFVLFGYDAYPSLQTNLLGTNNYFHNPTDQIRLRGTTMSRKCT